jgi:flagellar motor switch protein FliN/FliY
MSDPVLLQPGETWLLEQWLERFSQVLQSMIDERPSLTWTTEGSEDLGENALLMEQKFAPSPDPLVWLGVPAETWRDVGGRVLQAAGIETVSDEEGRNTCLEMLQQSIGGLAQAMTNRLLREIVSSGAREPAFFPQGLTVIRVTIQYGDKALAPLWIAFAPLLNSWLEEKPPADDTQTGRPAEQPDEHGSLLASKTFDLLLDVALPVSVSFGRTSMAVKEVLRLTTGSIIELNRTVSEPVEVIVNDCVIARGEVVVVDGNYGVRIHQIVSRQDRLRTGSAGNAALRLPHG